MENTNEKTLKWEKPTLNSLNAIKQANGWCSRGSGDNNCETGEVPGVNCSAGTGDL